MLDLSKLEAVLNYVDTHELNSPIRSKERKPKLLGIAIRTRRRKCVVLVYFR